jgi:tight adherence protein B
VFGVNPSEWAAFLMMPVACYGLVRFSTSALLQYQQEKNATQLMAESRNLAGRAFTTAKLQAQMNLLIVVGTLAALVGLFVTGSLILPLVVLAGCLMLPRYIRASMIARRNRKFEEQFPDALALLSSTLRAGISMPLAVAKVAEESSAPLSEEFGLLRREIQLGRTEQGFQELSQRIPNDSVKLFVTAVVTCMKMGGNLAEMSDSIAQTIRNNIELRGELNTLTAEGRLQGMMMAAMPFIVVGMISLVNPELVEPLFTHWIGNIMLGVVVVLEVVGALIIREMLKIED